MNCTIEVEIFDDDLICGMRQSRCPYLEGRFCTLFNIDLKAVEKNGEFDLEKCDSCKRLYNRAV